MEEMIGRKTERALFCTGMLLAASELWKQICITFVLNGGKYDPAFCPFQLCSVPIYVLLLLPVLKNGARNAAYAFLSDFTLLSGGMAFFDTTGFRQYGLPALVVHSYVWHLVLILCGITAGIARIREKRLRGWAGATGIYLVCCALAETLNFALGRYGYINMFYINPRYEMSQIVFRDIGKVIGNGPVIAFYILMTIVGAGMIELFWRLISGTAGNAGNGTD